MAESQGAPISVKVSVGSVKHTVQWIPSKPLQEFKEHLEKLIDIPAAEQKLIHRGKALVDSASTMLSLGVRNGEKIMVIRVKPDFELDPQYREIVSLGLKCSPLLSRLADIECEFKGMKQGFLDDQLQVEALPKISKRLASVNEDFMKLLEKLDTFRFNDDQKEAKLKRRDLVVQIQDYMEMVDNFSKKVDAQYEAVSKKKGKAAKAGSDK